MIRSARFVAFISALAFAVLLSTDAVLAQVKKPFKIRGSGVGPFGLPLPGQEARPHWIDGVATHLGRHSGDGYVQTDSAAPLFDDQGNLIGFAGEFGSGIESNGTPMPFEFRGADGDKLVCMYGRTAFGASQPGVFTLTIVDILEDGSLVVEALFVAEFVPMPDRCTGRFAGIGGSWTMIARTEPFVLGSSDPVYYEWEGESKLIFKQ